MPAGFAEEPRAHLKEPGFERPSTPTRPTTTLGRLDAALGHGRRQLTVDHLEDLRDDRLRPIGGEDLRLPATPREI